MVAPSPRVFRRPVLASTLAVLAACFGGTAGLAFGSSLETQPLWSALLGSLMVGLLFSPVGILLGGLPALLALMLIIWPCLLGLSRVAGLNGRASVAITWMVVMIVLVLLAQIPSGTAWPMWKNLVFLFLGSTTGALVLFCFASGPPTTKLDIAWQQD
ncbi:hypothetical protein [Brevundimonas sp. GCM10030266]|uniref:hypothetical protein n=1 Tax=Brevundimonas sp. GCM10030266 TaxID=3273386 RepID=UPI00360BB897